MRIGDFGLRILNSRDFELIGEGLEFRVTDDKELLLTKTAERVFFG